MFVQCLPALFEELRPNCARVTLFEGRYRQLRRMFGATNNRVLSIRRISLGGAQLGPLPLGHWRLVTEIELSMWIEQVARTKAQLRKLDLNALRSLAHHSNIMQQ